MFFRLLTLTCATTSGTLARKAANGGQKEQADKGEGKIVRTDAKALRGGAFPECIHAAMADGSVQTIKPNFNEEQIRRAITRNDGEIVDMDQLIDPAPGADANTLRKDNDEMRRQIEAAHREVIEQTRRLRAVRLKGESRNLEKDKSDETAELSALKREHQLLKQELERLESEIRRLKQEIDGGGGSKSTAPGRTKH